MDLFRFYIIESFNHSDSPYLSFPGAGCRGTMSREFGPAKVPGKKFRNFCNQQSGAMRSNNNRKIPKNVLPKRGAQNRKIAQVPLRQPEIDSNIPTHLSVSQRKNVSPRSFNFVRFIETTCDSDVPQSDIATLQDTETIH